jgi:uncharacterized SAM-binding protein YcdF (DUF218 family)
MSGRRWRRRARDSAVLVVMAGLGMFAGGLVRFVQLIPTAVADPDRVTDAIVVLTGGSLRIESGVQLLSAGKAQKLFVTGVHQGVDVSQLLRASGEEPERAACCIVLGHEAESTFGNAQETAAFVRDNNVHSLRLVTASYHMPRSLLEFARALPGVAIVPNPVFPEALRGSNWWLKPASLSLVTGEFVKYLVAEVRPHLPGAA